MKRFETSIAIAATPETIWAILTDGPRWAEWNPTVDKLEGTIAPGQKLQVYVKISPGRPFALTVGEFSPPTRMVWSSSMMGGMFSGTRTYTLTPKADGTVTYTMREEFAGLLAPLITRVLPDMQPSFNEFAAALKKRAEQE